ncbi:MAG: hypothetical protein GXP32_05430 [Kiritimatiellaeota bacterium]|nr:hypothetical protein [Kiritimatiellota bacterium]
MGISTLNRYFAKHGRWVFAIFAVVISFTFVMYFSRISLMDLFKRRGRSTSISLLGRTVTLDDRKLERQRELIIAAMRNPAIDLKRTNYPLSSRQLITQLALSYAADDMGIAVSDDAVAEYIKKIATFQTDGKFDLKKYDDFVKNNLKPALLSKTDMDEAVRGQLKIDYLRKCVADNIIIPEDEIKEAYKNLNCKALAKRVVFKAGKYADKVKVTEKALRDFFESRKNEYLTAPAAKGEYVLFDPANYRSAVEKSVSLDEVRKYYETHKFMYREKEPEKTTKTVLKKDSKPTYKPLAEVSSSIRADLVKKKAGDLAFAAAQKFSDNLYNSTVDVFYEEQDKKAARAKCAGIFRNAAVNTNLKAKATGWLSLGVASDSKTPKFDKAFVSALNNLRLDNPLSEPVKCEKGVFVAILENKRPSRPKTFEEARDKVKVSYVREKSLNLAREHARNMALKISAELAEGVKFEEIAKKLKLKFEALTIAPYSNVSQAESEAAFGTPVGKLSKIVPTSDGASLLYVTGKPIPTADEYKKRGRYFAFQYKMWKRGDIFRSYVDSLLATSPELAKQKKKK